MSNRPKFSDYQDDLEQKCNSIVEEFISDKEYNEDTIQDLSQELTSKVISELHNLEYGLKYVCSSAIFKKGDTEISFSSNCLWEKDFDGNIKVIKENDTITCLLTVFCLAP